MATKTNNMKPDIEINGRYFVEARGYGNYKKILTFISILNSDVDNFTIDYDKEINGKCWVELEPYYSARRIMIARAGEVINPSYKIKLTESGKAIVLTELPKQSRMDKIHEQVKATREFMDVMAKQSSDKLAEEILSDYEFEEHISNDVQYFKMDVIKAMQEYHRRRMRQELCDFFVEIYYQISQGNISTKNTPEQIVNKWLESRNNKL